MAIRELRLVRRWRTALVVVIVLTLLLVAGGFLWYRVVYHSFAVGSAPPRITYCGRDYQDGGTTLTRAQIESQQVALPGDPPYQLSSIGDIVPVLGWPLWAKLTPQDRRAQLGLPCTMGIYLQQGPDSYLSYGLLGGP